MFALEWPVGFIAGSAVHRSLEVRLAILPLSALAAILLYQATNAAIYYMIGMVVYFVAYSEGEVSVFLVLLSLMLHVLTVVSDHLCKTVDTAPAWQRGWRQGMRTLRGRPETPFLRASAAGSFFSLLSMISCFSCIQH